jgi:hypothetical protein
MSWLEKFYFKEKRREIMAYYIKFNFYFNSIRVLVPDAGVSPPAQIGCGALQLKVGLPGPP